LKSQALVRFRYIRKIVRDIHGFEASSLLGEICEWRSARSSGETARDFADASFKSRGALNAGISSALSSDSECELHPQITSSIAQKLVSTSVMVELKVNYQWWLRPRL
jgi:hypothetical protein